MNRARARTGTGCEGRERDRDGTKGCPDSIGVAPATKYHRLVIPGPTYANSGVQPSADNRTGYVVDLAGNIYELLLLSSFRPSLRSLSFPRSLFLSLAYLFVHSLISFIHLFISSFNVEQIRTLQDICISVLASERNSFSRSVFEISECNSLGRPSYLLTAVVEPARERVSDSVSLRLPGIAYRFKHFSGESHIDATCIG